MHNSYCRLSVLDLLSHQVGQEDRRCLLCPSAHKNKSSSAQIKKKKQLYLIMWQSSNLIEKSWLFVSSVLL